MPMSKAELDRLMEEVRENQRKLHECPGPHQFERVDGEVSSFKCTTCDGTLDGVNYHWYSEGLRHAKLAT